MNTNTAYEKPSLKFVSIRGDKQVANTCWGGHGKPEHSWYYDISGEGYVSFQIAEGSCTLNLTNVQYHESIDDQNLDPVDKGSKRYEELYAALEKAGGNDGNPFKGENVNFPTKPEESWS